MLLTSLHVIAAVWVPTLLGAGLLLIGVGAGWSLAATRDLFPVRMIRWWIRSVVRPLLRCHARTLQAGGIFLNNGVILTLLVASGGVAWCGHLMTALIGIGLGAGLRILSTDATSAMFRYPERNRPQRRRLRLGVTLNLFEPPAILLAIGLAMGRAPASLSGQQVWMTFAVWVLLALLIAAVGEALWLGACRSDGSDPMDGGACEPKSPGPPVP